MRLLRSAESASIASLWMSEKPVNAVRHAHLARDSGAGRPWHF